MTRSLRSIPAFLLALVLAACGGGGSSAGGTGPAIAAFEATPAATNAGRAVTLSWSVPAGTALRLDPGAIDVSGRSSYVVTPATTTDYRLVASDANGSSVRDTTVRIYDWSRTQAALDRYVAAGGTGTVAGYGFALFDRLGPLYRHAGGDATDAKVRLVASASKLPSAAAILTLVDRGLLDLDLPVRVYLLLDPTFAWPLDKTAITMRMLLSHTAGLVGLADAQPACLNDETGTTLRDCAQAVAQTTLVATPGSAFNYGGADMQVAGYIATLLSGQSWQDFFAAGIAQPLGLTVLNYGSGANPRIAGGLRSDLGDYASFLSMILDDGVAADGTRVLSSRMAAELRRDEIAGKPVRYAPFPASREGDYPGYGFGVFLSAPALHPGSPGPEFSDPGLFGTTPWFDDGLGYGAVLLIGDTTATGLNIWDAVRPTIITQLTGS